MQWNPSRKRFSHHLDCGPYHKLSCHYLSGLLSRSHKFFVLGSRGSAMASFVPNFTGRARCVYLTSRLAACTCRLTDQSRPDPDSIIDQKMQRPCGAFQSSLRRRYVTLSVVEVEVPPTGEGNPRTLARVQIAQTIPARVEHFRFVKLAICGSRFFFPWKLIECHECNRCSASSADVNKAGDALSERTWRKMGSESPRSGCRFRTDR